MGRCPQVRGLLAKHTEEKAARRREANRNSGHVKGVAAYHDLQHAVRQLVNHCNSTVGKNTNEFLYLGSLACVVGADARLPDRSVRSTRTRQGNSGKALLAGPLGPRPLGSSFLQALACGTARSWATRLCGWLFVGLLGQRSWRLTARRRSSAGPLGLSALREQPACSGDKRQTPTVSDSCPLDNSVL